MTTPNTSGSRQDMTHRGFKAWRLILGVALGLLLVPLWTQWYADRVSLPRYCENPEQTLAHLGKVLREKRPADDQARRPYMIAAKLLFLIPRSPDESVPDYLARVGTHLESRCR